LRRILAWGVHLYTALGLLAAAGIAVFIVRGGDEAFRAALLLMIAATLIDSTDGWLARRARVKEFAPNFDGRRLDDLIDFQTYTSLPLLLIWRAGLLEGWHNWWLLLPLLASAYGFSQVNAKTDDGFFLGFPSYWNIVAFYLYLLRPHAWISLALIIGLSLLTFVPWRYLYSSQSAPYSRLTNLLAVAWVLLLIMILTRWHEGSRWLILLSLAFPAYYMLMSWALTLRRWRLGRTRVSVRAAGTGAD
jgi:phosphatidylcholine synthase